jgi:hypothetical protein
VQATLAAVTAVATSAPDNEVHDGTTAVASGPACCSTLSRAALGCDRAGDRTTDAAGAARLAAAAGAVSTVTAESPVASVAAVPGSNEEERPLTTTPAGTSASRAASAAGRDHGAAHYRAGAPGGGFPTAASSAVHRSAAIATTAALTSVSGNREPHEGIATIAAGAATGRGTAGTGRRRSLGGVPTAVARSTAIATGTAGQR